MNNSGIIEPFTRIRTSYVEHIRHLNSDVYVLRFSRKGISFKAGQYLYLGTENTGKFEAYSIYSSEHDNYLEALIKTIPNGNVSRLLRSLKQGDELLIKEPNGQFLKEVNSNANKAYLFIASGTGIAPFHSIIKTIPNLNYNLLHGIRQMNERYDFTDYDEGRYISFVSREEGGDFSGRITEHFDKFQLDSETQIYICGNREMIINSCEMLKSRGVNDNQLHTEIY